MKAFFFQAVKDGNAERVKELLQCGDYINATDEYGRTPLHEAARKGHLNVAEELLKHEADVNATTYDGRTPLHLAAAAGHLGVAQKLLERKAKVDAKDNYGGTPLHEAARKGHFVVAKELLLEKHGAEVNARDQNGETPLHMAADGGHLGVAQKLLERKAKVNAKTKRGGTPLHLAADGGHLGVAKELLQRGADVKMTDNDGRTPLHLAAYRGHLNVVEELLLEEHGADVNAKDNDGRTPLHLAADGGHLGVAKELLQRGADVKMTDNNGRTPLHFAAYKGPLEVAKELLQHKADVNAKDNDGRTPLHEAAHEGQLEVAEELLKLKADVNAKDRDESTPLHLAAVAGYLGVAQKLLERKGKVNATDEYGRTPLHEAARKGRLNVAEELLKLKADVNAKTRDESSPLHLAVLGGHLDVANELLKHEADVNAKDKDGKTALDFAGLRVSWLRVAKMAHCSPKDLVQHTPELVKIIVDKDVGPPELDLTIVLLSRLEELVQDCPNPIETAEASQAADAEDEAERGKLMLLAEALLEVDMPSWPANRVRSLKRELPRPPFEIGLEMLEQLLGAKVARLGLHSKDQPEKLEDLGKPGVSRFIGQEEVIKLVKPLIKHRNDPVSAEGAPVCLLFNGPPGCGKTELAKKIAEAVFEEPIQQLRDNRRFIKFDMGQFDDAVHANNFFGAPLGYAGGEGTLFKALRECCPLEQASEVGKGCPEAVVLLDELDKAHEKIRRDALLAAVDTDGQVQSNQGGMALRTERVIFIFTSNVIPSNNGKDSMTEALARVFGKPLLSRTEVMQFESLARDGLLDQLVENQLLRCKKNFQHHAKFKVPLLWTEQVPHMLVQAIKQKAEQEHRQIDTRQLCRAELPKMLRELLHDHEDYKSRASKGETPVAFVLKVSHEKGSAKEAQRSLEKAQAKAKIAREAHDKAMNVVIQEQKKLQSLQGEVVPAHIWRSAQRTDQQAPAASVGPSLSLARSLALANTLPADPPLAGSPAGPAPTAHSHAGPAPTAHSHARAPAVDLDNAKAQLAATEIEKLQAQLAAEVAKREQVAAEAANQKSTAEMERREQWAAEVARMKQEHKEAEKKLKAAAEAAKVECEELQGKLNKVRERARRAKTVSWLVFAGSTATLVALLLYRYPWTFSLAMVLVALAAAVSLILLIAYFFAWIAKKQDAFCSWLKALKDRIVAGIRKCTLKAIERSIVACFKFFCCSCKGGALGFGIFTFGIISFFMTAWHAAIDKLFTLALLGTALAPVQVGIINWLVEDSEPTTADPPIRSNVADPPIRSNVGGASEMV